MSKKVVPLFGKRPTVADKPKSSRRAPSLDEAFADMTARAVGKLREGIADTDSREQGITESNVTKRMDYILRHNLDLNSCLTRGGSWTEAARRLQSSRPGTGSSPPPSSITVARNRRRGKGKKE